MGSGVIRAVEVMYCEATSHQTLSIKQLVCIRSGWRLSTLLTCEWWVCKRLQKTNYDKNDWIVIAIVIDFVSAA